MEKCEIEVTEESKIKMEAEEDSVQTLGKHLGKLLVILELAGIPITESRKGSRQGYLLDLFRKVCFPIFLHLSCLYLLYERISKGGLNYGTVIDTLLPILPCIMWIMMRCQNASLKLFLADLSRITSSNFKSQNRSLSYTTNVAICFIFIYPLLLLAIRILQENVVNVIEVFRILQEALFPNTMAIVYIAICYLLLQKLRFCKKMFLKRLDLTCPTAVNMMKDYLNVTKCVENFENLLCNITFVILLHDLCIVTILLIDMFYIEDFMALIFYEALAEMLYVFFSLGIMAVCAGNVSLEISAIKSVLSEKMFTQLDQGDVTNNEKHINLLLRKDVCVLTVGKALVFDRGFILKALLAVLAEVIFISELSSFIR
ncbi:hypothetical protein AVEN_200675-1 [Araneus ventricosus]|uniref:Gustatory receptor n=1 Tax=Araneus ventricosus TaxID=182803 RepID=A0A4Y2L715_ARAVE|nr:hypothetical protein AVEN_200675-1 [Araneus ventricosus]